MKLVDNAIRYAIPTFGIATRWLREELSERGVNILLAEACLRELVTDAASAVKGRAASPPATRLSADGRDTEDSYAARLRREIAARAEFLRLWTQSDDPIDTTDGTCGSLVRVARKFALPRPWRLTEPVASECRRRVPSYLRWASAG